MTDASLWRDAIPGYYDDAHPEDAVQWTARHRYVTSTLKQRGGRPTEVYHILSARLDFLPDAYRAACSRVIRGEETTSPTGRLCPRCQREVGDA